MRYRLPFWRRLVVPLVVGWFAAKQQTSLRSRWEEQTPEVLLVAEGCSLKVRMRLHLHVASG